ncbi:MAG: adenylate/guanylate cyclase domain-containing protein [Acidimicrobiales bacterium]
MLEVSDFHALGLYDGTEPHADQRLELLQYLVGLGATADDLLAYSEALPALAMVLAVRGGAALTLSQAAARSGLSEEGVRRIVRAAGFAEPPADQAVFTEGFASLAALLGAATGLFGEPAVYQLVRVFGASMARVAHAIVSAFLVNIEPAARLQDPVGLAVARANVDTATLLPMLAPALDVLLRQHLLAAQRTVIDPDVPGPTDFVGYETQPLIVGFVDLVGSTELAERISMAELGAVLTTFENLATDMVTAAGGRVVKLIGDEILFTASDAASTCAVALDLAEAFRDHAVVPPIRAGLAGGKVMLRDGDVFGPVVNLAARAVKAAAASEVVAPAELVEAAGLPSEPRGRHELKGFAEPVVLRALLRR